MTPVAAYAIAVGAAVVAAWLVPALAMRALAPSLAASELVVENYRGSRVYLGLGVVWVVWAVSLMTASTVFDAVLGYGTFEYGSVEAILLDGPLTMPLYAVPLILTLVAAFFGLADDVFGTREDKGFRGHLRALFSGRLSTGGLKLLGIGTLAAVYGWRAAAQGADAQSITNWAVRIGWWIAATLVIALCANLVNLTDLRPGRALKMYSLLAVGAGTVFALDLVQRYASYAADLGITWGAWDTAVTVACMLIVLLGPVAAIWRFDLREQGMLGDSGSNAMGAIVGYLLAGSLPLPSLAAVAVVLLGLNLLSERVSFSAVIDAVAPLRFFDRLGRLKDANGDDEESGSDSS
jgi:hypothetical protein